MAGTGKIAHGVVGRVGLAVVACAVVLACAPRDAPTRSPSQQSANPAPAQGQSAPGQRTQVRIAYTTDIPSMFPYANSSSPDYARWSQIYDTISRLELDKLEYVPLLAESWRVADPNTWEIKLKRDVKFHNGNAFTADDVLFSLDRIDNDPQSQQKEKMANVAEVVKVDDYTVLIRTKTPDASIMAEFNNISILDKETHDQLGSDEADKRAIGTGPYMFKEWVAGQRMVLERNPNYHGPDKPTIDEAVYRVIPESEARVTALLNGEVDVIFAVPPQSIDRINGSGRAEVRGALENRPGFLAMNPTYAPWDNKNMRLAVNYAIDREGLVTGVLGGQAQALYTPVGPNTIGYDGNIQPQYRYDPERAKQLVAAAGYPGGIDVELGCPFNRYIKDKELCEAVAAMLNQVGIRTKVWAPEYVTLFANIRQGKIPFYMFSRGSVIDPSIYLHQYFFPGNTKRLQFEDAKLTELLLKERGTFDRPERLKVLSEVQTRIMEEAAMAFTLQYMLNYGVAKRIEWKARSDEYMRANEMRVR
jgi:peptide/nickel transport system substrate-binding protein